jgi:hypothetical protein
MTKFWVQQMIRPRRGRELLVNITVRLADQ